MKFEVNQEVWVTKENVIKTIIDKEIIDNLEIYYMSDSTSYVSFQLKSFEKKYQNDLEVIIETKKDNIVKLLKVDDFAKSWASVVKNALEQKS